MVFKVIHISELEFEYILTVKDTQPLAHARELKLPLSKVIIHVCELESITIHVYEPNI